MDRAVVPAGATRWSTMGPSADCPRCCRWCSGRRRSRTRTTAVVAGCRRGGLRDRASPEPRWALRGVTAHHLRRGIGAAAGRGLLPAAAAACPAGRRRHCWRAAHAHVLGGQCGRGQQQAQAQGGARQVHGGKRSTLPLSASRMGVGWARPPVSPSSRPSSRRSRRGSSSARCGPAALRPGWRWWRPEDRPRRGTVQPPAGGH